MRISRDERCPGWNTWARLIAGGLDVEVYLDGKRIENVIALDTDQRFVVAYSNELDRSGNSIAREIRRGFVWVRLVDVLPAIFLTPLDSYDRSECAHSAQKVLRSR